MELTRDNFGELLVVKHREVFFNAYTEIPEQFPKIFKVDKMTKKEETIPRMGAFGLWKPNTEGNTINESTMHQGDTVTFVALRYDNGYNITWELVQDDQYNVFKGLGANNKSATMLGRGCRATVETECAKVLNNGFTNVGYDGVSLFNNSHPLAEGGTSDNLTTGALTDLTLKEACILMRDQVDEAGIKIAARPKQLIVPPALEYTAKAIIYSTGPAGELSNDTNTVDRLGIVVMDYLSSNTAWFVKAESIDNLLMLWREKPFFDMRTLTKQVDMFFFGYTRFSPGYVDWRGLVGSTGL